MAAQPSNIPAVSFENLFLEDPVGEKLFEWWLGGHFLDTRKLFLAMGERGAKATPLSRRADRITPVLETHDPTGERINRVVFHPDYVALQELSYGGGIVAIKYDPAFLEKHREVRHRVGFGVGYYFAQTEMGLFCPICMTDG